MEEFFLLLFYLQVMVTRHQASTCDHKLSGIADQQTCFSRRFRRLYSDTKCRAIYPFARTILLDSATSPAST